MKQLQLDLLIRQTALQDGQIWYALAYGSLTQGTGDPFSDVEYYFYGPEPLNAEQWLRQTLAGTDFELLHATTNEFGTPNFIVSGLIRVELHVQLVEKMPDVLDWPNQHIFPERMLIKDRGGRLLDLLHQLSRKPQAIAEAEAQQHLDRALNWLVFGRNVLERGERIRALELLWWIQGHLLKLARLSEGQTGHWLNPSRLAEQELSAASLERYAQVTGGIGDLERCYGAALEWLIELAELFGFPVNPQFQADLNP